MASRFVTVEIDPRDELHHSIAAAVRDVTVAVRVEYGIGTCDECDTTYDTSDRVLHCGDCGTCWEHCYCGAAPETGGE